jgi:two-component system NtrC family sensor kinase
MTRTLLTVGEPWSDALITAARRLGIDVRSADVDGVLDELAARPADVVHVRLAIVPSAMSVLARVRHAFPDTITLLSTEEEPDLQIVSDALIGAGVTALLCDPVDPIAIAREVERAAERLRPPSAPPGNAEPIGLERKLERMARALDRERALRTELEQLLEDKTRELYLAAEREREQQRSLVASEKLSALGRMAAGVAHEINNALNIVRGNLPHLESYVEAYRALLAAHRSSAPDIAALEDELRIEFIERDLPKLMAAMTIGVERATQIVHDMAVFSRGDEGMGFERVSIDEPLTVALTLAAARIGRGVTVHVDEPATPPIDCHSGRLSQVLLNLLINASDAIGDRGEIFVTRALEGDRVVVSVRDTGGGVPAELADRLFEPFFTTKPVGSGTGLGLFVSKQIVEEHGGSIGFRSSPSGTTFVVSLPIARAT